MAQSLASILSGVPADPASFPSAPQSDAAASSPLAYGIGSLGQVLIRALGTAPYVMAEAARGGQDTDGGMPDAIARAATAVPLAAWETNSLGLPAIFPSPQDSFSALARQFGVSPSTLRALRITGP